MTSQLFGLTWSAWGAIAILVALFYSFFWPRPRNPAHAERRSATVQLILRWAHPIVWLLLVAYFKGIRMLQMALVRHTSELAFRTALSGTVRP